MYVIKSTWPSGLRNLVLIGLAAAALSGWAVGAGTDSLAAGLGMGVGAAALFGGIVAMFHYKEVRGVPGAVAFRADADGVYLSNPPRQLPWPGVREVLVYELSRPFGESDAWLPQVTVRTDTSLEVLHDLLIVEPVNVEAMRLAVHAHAPDVAVTDLGGLAEPPT